MSNNKSVIHKKCTNCGNAISDLETICPNCGRVANPIQSGDISNRSSTARSQSYKTISRTFEGMTQEQLSTLILRIILTGAVLGIVLALVIGSNWETYSFTQWFDAWLQDALVSEKVSHYIFAFVLMFIMWLIISLSFIPINWYVRNKIEITIDDEAKILDPPDMLEQIGTFLSEGKITQKISESVLSWRRGFLVYLVKVKHSPDNVVVNREFISLDPEKIEAMKSEQSHPSSDVYRYGKQCYMDAFEIKRTETKEGKIKKVLGNHFVFFPTVDERVLIELANTAMVYHPDDPEYIQNIWDQPYLVIAAGSFDNAAWNLSKDSEKAIVAYSLNDYSKSKNMKTSLDEYAKKYRSIEFNFREE